MRSDTCGNCLLPSNIMSTRTQRDARSDVLTGLAGAAAHQSTPTSAPCAVRGFNSGAREAVFTPSLLVPGEQKGERVPNVHSLTNGLLKLHCFPLCLCVWLPVWLCKNLIQCRGMFSHTNNNFVKIMSGMLRVVRC